MMMGELFAGKKGFSMAKGNKVVYKDVLHLLLGFLFVALIFCDGSSVCADGGKANHKLAGRYISDGLLLYNELETESGTNFLKARRVHADLLAIYVDEMEARELDYAAALLTEEAAGILANLKSIGESLAEPVPEDIADPNVWAQTNIKQASRLVGELLSDFEPYLEDPFDLDGFEELGDKCRKALNAALENVKVKLGEYIKDLTIKNAEELCLANRRAIVLLFLNRFARFDDQWVAGGTSNEGLDLRVLRQFRGDINRTIYWNRVLQKRLKESDASLIEEYSSSELRRLRILHAVLNNDMREAQALLLITFRASFPAETTSDESR